jgi:hypothetical protein
MSSETESPGTIDTPKQAKIISRLLPTEPALRKSLLTAVSTSEMGLESYDLKLLINQLEYQLKWINTVAENSHLQLIQSVLSPHLALQHGLILLNGAAYLKENFPNWDKICYANFAKDTNATTFTTIDLTKTFVRNHLANAGIAEAESLPNISGTFKSAGGFAAEFKSLTGAMHAIEQHDNSNVPTTAYYNRPSSDIVYFSANKSHATYGRRNEVAPYAFLFYAYCYAGEYRGEMPLAKTYNLVATAVGHTGKQVTLPGTIGFNAKYMIA